MQNANRSFLIRLGSLTAYIKKEKLMFGIIAAAGISLVLYFVLSGSSKASGDYLTDTVKRGTITSTISASGMVEPVETISMSFKNAEIVKKIYVKVGDVVKPGQLLAELETGNLDADVLQAQANLSSQSSKLELLRNGSTQEDLEQAEANVSMSQASYDLAKATLERNQALYQAGALSLSELDQVKADFANADGKLKQAKSSFKSLQKGSRPEDIASAAAQVESARAQLQVAKNALSDARLVSPIDGIVSSINGAEGQRATANNNNTSGDGFMTVISEALQVKAQVNEGDIGKTRLGQKVEFTVNSYPNKTFSGKVSSISPMAYTESNVQIYDVIIQLDEKYTELKAGMPANVTIIVDRHDNVLTVPKGATTYAISYLNKMRQTATTQKQGGVNGGYSSSQGQKPGENNKTGQGRIGGAAAQAGATAAKDNEQTQRAIVLVLDKSDTPVPKRVELGLSDLTSYEILNGLSEGDTVIIGSLSQSATSGAVTGSQRANQPFMPVMSGGGRR